jgi:nicotinate-nucleotide--dimethylbenzimidazole phosphoribosyltransferase
MPHWRSGLPEPTPDVSANNMERLRSVNIPSVENPSLASQIKARWDNLTKPPGSLGQLEELVTRYALIRGECIPELARKSMHIFCADHGVTAEGVSAYPSAVTAQMVRNFLRGGAAINVLCRHYGIETTIVDCGVDAPCEDGVIDCRIARGTRNFAQAPAMTREQAELSIENGMALARKAAASYDIAGVGEMGIGNTTAASALLCAFAKVSPIEAAGRGAGLDTDGVLRKASVIERALALHAPKAEDPIGVLASIGGFEISTMTGFLLGAAESRLPVVVDGFIATSAALVAAAIAPDTLGALFFAHCSAERAHRAMLSHLGVRTILDLDMRLGEGSASALAIGVLECGVKLYREMATFDDLS